MQTCTQVLTVKGSKLPVAGQTSREPPCGPSRKQLETGILNPLGVDLILHGGRIETLDSNDRVVSALAARSGRIVALGDDADVLPLCDTRTEVIDLIGRTVIPGIIDSHCHPDGYAARLARWHEVSPTTVSTRADLLERINTVCRDIAPGEWFLGYRLNENRSGGYPTLAELDAASEGRPVFILRTDGHLGLVNTAAFAALQIGPDEPDPPFGRFDRDPQSGVYTGLVRETAAHRFLDHIHANDTVEQIATGLEDVFETFLSHGVTTIYNSLAGRNAINAYQTMARDGRLAMRVGIIVSGREPGLVESFVSAGVQSGFGDDWVKVIGVEWCPDCSTSGRTAAYFEPYQGTAVDGEPANNTGMLLYEFEDLAARATAAHRAGLQVMVEGVGDRGIAFALDVIEAALEAHPVDDHRMRVEHCCFLTPELQDRMLRLGVVDSSATGFMYELGDAYRANRGESAMRWMWPHRTAIDRGIRAPGHSDAWVCSPNPFTALYAMVNRKTDSGQCLDTTEAVSAREALRAYTTLGAWSGREETDKGSLETGKLADLAVLDRDYFTIPPEEIKDVNVDITVVGGHVKYQRS